MTRWEKELEKVRAAHKGILFPKHIVQAARAKDSPLHDHFEWDDTKAGHAYRLQQAAELIREVTFLPEGAKEPIRAYASLSSDRLAGGGMRAVVDVLSDEALRAQWLSDALAELKAFSLRYDRISDVARIKPVFREIHKAIKRQARPSAAR